MRVGISAYDVTATDLVALAAAADELGFASLWLGEHVVLPLDYRSEHPTTGDVAHQHHTGPIVDPSTRLVDPLVTLAAAAAVTRHITLATGIYLLPLRPPMVTARMTATLADLSGGRFALGVGSGWLEEEFTAVGVPFAERGPRLDESIDVLRAAWSGRPFAHRGRFWQTGRVQLSEAPVAVPLILGGNTPRALRRAATRGDGWFSSGTPAFDDAVALRHRLAELRAAEGRSGPFPTYVRIATAEPGEVDRYARAGFDHVVVWADQVWPARGDLDHKRAALAAAAGRLGVTPPRPEEGA